MHSLESNPILINSKPCKPSLALGLFLFLPSIIAFLILLLFFSLFLFFPIICILIAMSLLSSITSLMRIDGVGRVVNRIGALVVSGATQSEYRDLVLGLSVPDYIEFDTSDAPVLDASSLSSSTTTTIQISPSSSGEECVLKEVIRRDLLDFEALRHSGSDGERTRFYEILSYWRKKEKAEQVETISRRLGKAQLHF